MESNGNGTSVKIEVESAKNQTVPAEAYRDGDDGFIRDDRDVSGEVKSPLHASHRTIATDYFERDEDNEIVQSTRETFYSGKTRPLKFRMAQLLAIKKMMLECEADISKALVADFRRSHFENCILEINPVLNEVRLMIDRLDEWSAPETPSKAMANLFDKVVVYKEPHGVVLIIAAWNFPLQLTLIPLIGAIATGNCAILKPSEVSVNTTMLISELIAKYLDNDCYKVVLGGVTETTELLKHKFDYIFYTGSTAVGRSVREASNKYLTPTTLELGGKNPVYIDNTANMAIAAKRILWGKYINAGQICTTPDFIMCSLKVQNAFVNEARKVLKEWYGDDPQSSPYLCRIINNDHFQRLITYLTNGDVAIGGKVDASERYISPTILINVLPSDPVMADEILGPILPIINVGDVNAAIKFINERERPLALYVFSKQKKEIDQLVTNTFSGMVTVNDTITHTPVHNLPYGGNGNSGMGAYHGKYSFNTFVHPKGCLMKDFYPVMEKVPAMCYPPYTDRKLKMLTFIAMKKLDLPGRKYLPFLLVFILGILTAKMF